MPLDPPWLYQGLPISGRLLQLWAFRLSWLCGLGGGWISLSCFVSCRGVGAYVGCARGDSLRKPFVFCVSSGGGLFCRSCVLGRCGGVGLALGLGGFVCGSGLVGGRGARAGFLCALFGVSF